MAFLNKIISLFKPPKGRKSTENSSVKINSRVINMNPSEAAAKAPSTIKPYWRDDEFKLHLCPGYLLTGTGIWDKNKLCTDDIVVGDIVYFIANKKLVKIVHKSDSAGYFRYRFRYQVFDRKLGCLVDEYQLEQGKSKTKEEEGNHLSSHFFARTLDSLVVDASILVRERAIYEGKMKTSNTSIVKKIESDWIG